MRANIMIRFALILGGFLASVLSLHVQEGSLRGRQTDDLVDSYPCWYCDTNDPANVGPDTCSETRDNEYFCTPNDEPPTIFDSANDYSLNETILTQESSTSSTWTINGKEYYRRFATCPYCSIAAKLEDTAVDKSQFQSDHVYEKQMLVDFFKWLLGEFGLVRWPRGYGYPSTGWVAGRLMGLDDNAFLTPFEWDGLSLWEHLVRELGSVYHQERLALVEGKINNMKGKFFGGARPREFPRAQSSIRIVKSYQRNITGVFQYLRQDEVWKLMTDTSKGIEAIFRTFDVEYAWDDAELDVLSWPDRKDNEGRPGLRDLYCHFIDERLRNVEYNAGVWLQTAKAAFDESVITDPDSPDEKQQWLDQFDTGILSEDAFTFPRVHQDIHDGVFENSEFSMWALGPGGPWL
ncbi:hypothetical protein IWZ03DRAFT_434309 [Phyllosticta citriasiana]|uniref:Uncharacterized protein n=1 Tax=Phyllosticta citriasiana TaxID=595635 RepID=A0ABR1K818_9PEZI